MKIYGPVPSRRLGRSLGINHVPPKTCTYSCVYCQVGRTRELTIDRRSFSSPDALARQVRERVETHRRHHVPVDYLSFVPDGEPCLDVDLGREIALVRRTGLPVAVISNASLLSRAEVREELAEANWVSLKVDSVDPTTWRRINRPHRSLDLDEVLDGILAFRRRYRGILVTETMLVAERNDSSEETERTAAFLRRLRPHRAYLSVPTRPPTVDTVRAPRADSIMRAYQVFAREVGDVELLTGYEGSSFATADEPGAGLVAIAAVHPMREEAVRRLVREQGATRDIVERLVDEGRLLRVEYEGHRYYLSRPAQWH